MMKQLNELDQILKDNIAAASSTFHEELSTDENKDYRRGFRAGVLFSFLHIKAGIGDISQLSAEWSIELKQFS